MNKIKIIVPTLAIIMFTAANAVEFNKNNRQQYDAEQLTRLITSRSDFILELSLTGVKNEFLVSELTTLRLLQDAYIQLVVDANNFNSDDNASLIDIKSAKKMATLKKEIKVKAVNTQTSVVTFSNPLSIGVVDEAYRDKYVRGLRSVGINLTDEDYKFLKTIKEQKEFLRFHKSVTVNYKKSTPPVRKQVADFKKKVMQSSSPLADPVCSIFE